MEPQKLEGWERPGRLDWRLVPIHYGAGSKDDFRNRFLYQDQRRGWFMTWAQRLTWSKEILRDWDQYKDVLKDPTGTMQHQAQLRDMAMLGGALIVVAEAYGTGKSIISNTHLKLWQILKKQQTGELLTPSVYFSKAKARRIIASAPDNSAHSIDESQESTGAGSQNLEVHIKNYAETVRKTGKLVSLVGVNTTPGILGKAVAIQIYPFGIHLGVQANRFIVKNHRNEPLYLAATQRCYYPHEPVIYPDGIGTWAEYYGRATRYSQETDGVITARDAQIEAVYTQELVDYYQANYQGVKPRIQALEGFAVQIGIPAESTKLISDVSSMALTILEKDALRELETQIQERQLKVDSRDWIDLRNGLEKLALATGSSSRDAKALGLYYVPEWPGMTPNDIAKELGLGIKGSSLQRQISRRRTDISTSAIGTLAEQALASWCESLRPKIGTGGKGQPDITLDIDGTTTAINVKITLEDSYKEQVSTTPEDQFMPNAYVALLLPRLLELRIYPIEGSKTVINGRKGTLTSPKFLTTKLKEMIV